jgi:predicted DNA-binding transcriptional regulator AlpA
VTVPAYVTEARRQVLAEARSDGRAAAAYLDSLSVRTLATPSEDGAAGEWDWYRGLDRAERRFVVERTSATGSDPSVIAETVRPGETVEAGMAAWLEYHRAAWAGRSITTANAAQHAPSVGMTRLAALGHVDAESLFGDQWQSWYDALDERAELDALESSPDALAISDGPAIEAPTWEGPPIVGLSEIASTLGKPLRTVYSWMHRGQLPAPVLRLAMGPVWYATDIEAWRAGIGAKYCRSR